MENETNFESVIWLQGCLWILYALAYGYYFGFLARSRSKDSSYDRLPGSPVRLRGRAKWCYRVAFFVAVATCLEAIRGSVFTNIAILIVPCLFGLWVLKTVWIEAFCCKVPVHRLPSIPKIKQVKKSKPE